MTNEELQRQIERLERELNNLKSLFYKDNYSNLQVFKKNVEFKGDVSLNDLIIADADITNISDLDKTGGTNVVADSTYTFNIASHTIISISTKNGIITAISIT